MPNRVTWEPSPLVLPPKQREVSMEPVLQRNSEALEGDASSSPSLWNSDLMHLKILLPFEIFVEESGVKRIVAETSAGSFGLLPHRLDCAAALTPGILLFETVESGEQYVAVAEGALTKTGLEVAVSVRNAVAGTDLRKLRAAVEQEFKNLDERERTVRSVLAKLESGFVRRFLEFQHG